MNSPDHNAKHELSADSLKRLANFLLALSAGLLTAVIVLVGDSIFLSWKLSD